MPCSRVYHPVIYYDLCAFLSSSFSFGTWTSYCTFYSWNFFRAVTLINYVCTQSLTITAFLIPKLKISKLQIFRCPCTMCWLDWLYQHFLSDLGLTILNMSLLHAHDFLGRLTLNRFNLSCCEKGFTSLTECCFLQNQPWQRTLHSCILITDLDVSHFIIFIFLFFGVC